MTRTQSMIFEDLAGHVLVTLYELEKENEQEYFSIAEIQKRMDIKTSTPFVARCVKHLKKRDFVEDNGTFLSPGDRYRCTMEGIGFIDRERSSLYNPHRPKYIELFKIAEDLLICLDDHYYAGVFDGSLRAAIGLDINTDNDDLIMKVLEFMEEQKYVVITKGPPPEYRILARGREKIDQIRIERRMLSRKSNLIDGYGAPEKNKSAENDEE